MVPGSPPTRGRTVSDIETIADESLAAIDAGRQIASLTARYPGFTLDDAYRVTATMREKRLARGERVLGRKIGFTNRTIWAEYNVFAPIWGYVYDCTLRSLGGAATFPLEGLCEPRIEPEIVFGLARAPQPGMDDRALLGCIEWIAHGFEIVQSIFPGWKFSPADTVAANGLHGALMVGTRHPVGTDSAQWLPALTDFSIDLVCEGAAMDRGRAGNVMEGPLSTLRHTMDLLASDGVNPPLAAGELVTTGTLTKALPIKPGETWSTALSGVPLAGISVRFS